MADAKREMEHTGRNVQMLVALVSVFFFGVITYGYYNLAIALGWLPAAFIGLLAALVAWWLARFVGENWHEPVAKVFGVVLFAISGAGVLNTAMLTSEGSPLLVDTTYRADANITALQSAARRAAAASPAAARVDRVDALTESLISEIKNPGNCGQGPEARRLIAALQRELPGFTPLSTTRTNCNLNDAMAADYRARIAALKAHARWEGMGLLPINDDAEILRRNIAAIRADIESNYSPPTVRSFVKQLESQNAVYQRLRSRLASMSDVTDVPPTLPLSAAQNLGNVAGLLAILFDRAGEVKTWSFLLAALVLDWGMCTLFALNKRYWNSGPRPVSIPGDY